ncbi:MAG: hypothetical protein GC192_24765 [Bacteroidetes bacterium]|nr:hypothetical protein [Bacteroidota bacterium]
MEFLEILLLVVASAYLLTAKSINQKLKKAYILLILALPFCIQIILVGPHWQIYPTYLIWLIAMMVAYFQPERKSSIVVRGLKVIGFTILLALAIALPSILPIFQLPTPTGPYTVGTSDIYFESNREEVITPDESDKRRLMIKTFYPSTQKNGKQDPYVDKGGRNGFARKYGLPTSTLNYLDKVETHVYRDIQIADETFPVIVFSHGYNSKANGYYAILSEIASHGYVVFAINHTYESTGTTFPDGSEVYFDYDYAGKIEANTWQKMEPIINAFKQNLSFEERHPIVEKGLTTYFVKGIVERWEKDIEDVISELDEWNNAGFFKGKLNTAALGVLGHSRGGGAAGDALLKDDRIKAGANLDGVQWGQIVDSAFQKPFLFLSADWPAEHENLNQHAYVNKSTSIFYEGILLHSGHSNFMDIPFMVPFKKLSEAGDIEPGLAIEITNKLTISFFDKYLKNKDVDILSLDSAYEMLKLKAYPGDSRE